MKHWICYLSAAASFAEWLSVYSLFTLAAFHTISTVNKASDRRN